MSSSSEEFEAKLGQFIYTMVMYERLKAYLLERASSRRFSPIRIELGKDDEGNTVYLDVSVTKSRKGEGRPRKLVPNIKRHLVLTMVNEKLTGLDLQIKQDLERLIEESLKWWHSYYREKDKLALNEWHTVNAEEVDCVDARPVFILPVESISIPPNLLTRFSEEQETFLAEIVDVLGPVYVKKSGPSSYELVAGLPKIVGCIKAGREYVEAYLIEDVLQGVGELLKLDDLINRLISNDRL